MSITRTITALGIVVTTASGCAAITDRTSDEAVEEVVERAVENDSGEDVAIDFDDDGISIESDDGDLTLTADEDGVQIEGSDADGGDFSLDADADGIELESDDGTGSLDIDQDGGFTVTGEDGEVFSGDVDTEGDDVGFTVEGEDGDAVFSSAEGIPEQWPTDIPRPEGLSDVTGTFFSEGDDLTIIATGTTTGDLADVFDAYTDALVGAGFEEESRFSQDGTAGGSYVRGDTTVSVTVQDVDGAIEMVVALG